MRALRGGAAIRATGVGFRYATRPEAALRDVSFDVEPGECLLVVGPSGSGKSTLALAVAGVIPREIPGAWSGRLEIDGLDVVDALRTERAAQVGVVFQDPGSQIVMDRVEDDVAFGLENRAWPADAMRSRVPEALDEVGIGALRRRRTAHLSGGEQQRLALAGALAPRPGVLVLDEPTSNLDPLATAQFFAGLRSIRKVRSATIVLIEHDADQAWALADRVLALGPDGAIVDAGEPATVLKRSRSRLRAEGVWLPGERGIGGMKAPPERALDVAPLVNVDRVSFGYERDVLAIRDANFVLGPGERVALVGPNGSGKSTLGRLLVGLLRPQRGRVSLAGDDPSSVASAVLARRAGYAFQDPEQQFLADRVEDEVFLGLRPVERDAAPALMDALGLPLGSFGARSPYALSGGEQRRLSLACILVRRPAVLVLDEPTFGQDRRGYEGLVSILRERVEAGTCLVAATHDERFVADVASRRISLRGGRVVADETIAITPSSTSTESERVILGVVGR